MARQAFTALTVGSVLTGLASGAAQLSYFNDFRPLAPELGIFISLLLGCIWFVMAAVAFIRHGRGALWTLAVIPAALIGPLALAFLILGCLVHSGYCL